MFIINKKEEYRSLEDFLSQKISYCEEVKILTGFFYFSSIDILIDFFKKNEHVKIKILVGLQVDVYNYGKPGEPIPPLKDVDTKDED